MNIKRASLQQKILLFFSLILVTITVLVSSTTLQSAYQHSNSQLSQSFDTARQVFLYKLQNDGNVLSGSLRSAAKDFNTKQLIASGKEDPESLAAVLVNQQRRSNADFSMVFDGEGQVIYSSLTETELTPEAFNSDAIRLSVIDGDVYLIKSTEVKFLEQQPQVDAWLLMGINLQKLVDESVQQLTGYEVSVISGDNYVFGTTNRETAELANFSLLPNATMIEVDINQQAQIAYRFFADEKEYTDVSFVFSIASESAFLNFFQLAFQLSVELIIAIAGAVLLSLYLSNNITKPLRVLAGVAKRIQQGDYHSPIPDFDAAEVNNLSKTFEGMQDSIQAREAEINQLAYYDTLTGLPNRNSFIKQLKHKIETGNGESFAVLMLDLDRFKEVNDTIGHNFGDQLLKLIGRRIESLKLADAFYARVGGDEFAILLNDVNERDLISMVKQYTHLFDLPFEVEGIHLDVDASFGLAVYPEHADSAYGIMQCADIALYKCKETHHNYIRYNSEFNTLSIQRLNLMSELRLAIEQDQLRLFYQPKLCLKTDEVVSVECLVRWVHPEHGFINPDEFIPLAEQSGAIRQLTHWVIRTALKQQQQWQQQDINLQFAVNISAVDLVDLSLPAYVSEQLTLHHVDNRYLTLEVTESALMSDPDAAIKALDMLQRMGIKLSIDDFGTGYSSMAYLKQMPVSELKIDKAFVLDLANSDDDEKIVKSTVDLAHNLGLSVVAEGVEDEASLEILKRYDVEFAQGYFIARPMNAEDFFDWMSQTNYRKIANA